MEHARLLHKGHRDFSIIEFFCQDHCFHFSLIVQRKVAKEMTPPSKPSNEHYAQNDLYLSMVTLTVDTHSPARIGAHRGESWLVFNNPDSQEAVMRYRIK